MLGCHARTHARTHARNSMLGSPRTFMLGLQKDSSEFLGRLHARMPCQDSLELPRMPCQDSPLCKPSSNERSYDSSTSSNSQSHNSSNRNSCSCSDSCQDSMLGLHARTSMLGLPRTRTSDHRIHARIRTSAQSFINYFRFSPEGCYPPPHPLPLSVTPPLLSRRPISKGSMRKSPLASPPPSPSSAPIVGALALVDTEA